MASLIEIGISVGEIHANARSPFGWMDGWMNALPTTPCRSGAFLEPVMWIKSNELISLDEQE